MEGDYVFESITVKTTENRFDGFLKRTIEISSKHPVRAD
jgi:hypothetical protein